MTDHSDPFDARLDYVRSDHVRMMTRLWGVPYGNKESGLAALRQARSDEAAARAAVKRLTTFERTALAVADWAGGNITSRGLMAAVRATGVEFPKTRSVYERDNEVLQHLLERGLFLGGSAREPTMYSSTYGEMQLTPDPRLLAHVGPLPYVPLALKPADAPATSAMRLPSSVALDMLALIEAIERLGGLQLTKAGAVRVPDQRKLARAMGWEKGAATFEGLHLPNPAPLLIDALRFGGVLREEGDAVVATGASDAFARLTYAEQVRQVLRGVLAVRDWNEKDSEDWYDSEGSRHAAGRLALSVALLALPDAPGAFFATDDFDAALFARIGEHFSLSYLSHAPYTHNKTPAEVKREEQKWREKLRAEWLARERPWIGEALATWLAYLGIVEVGTMKGAPERFRLTDLGRAVLHPEQSHTLDAPGEEAGAAWLVQPDFEVLVYLGRASAQQIAWIERHAVREQAQQHVARYRLTRESVYQALERGSTPDELLAMLKRGSGGELPQNVLFTLREWAEQRERITLRQRVSLLEFPDTAARDEALERGLAGRSVGERFVLLQGAPPAYLSLNRVEYDRPPAKSLTLSETGTVHLAQPTPDLLLRPRLDKWGDPHGDGVWQITRERVGAAVKAGAPVGQLVSLLQERLRHPMPPLFEVALRAWGGGPPHVALATVTALRCPDPRVFAAIAASPLLAPYLRGTLAPDVLLVSTADIAALRQRLAWAGFEIGQEIG